MSFMELTLPHCVLFQGILLIEGINMTSMMIMSVLLVMIIYFYISFCHHQLSQDQWMDVSFQNVQCLGFIDNGNKVFYKGYPVIFISKALLKDYQPIDKIRISTANQQEEVDIILIDEILAVGDQRFQEKCMDKMLELKKLGKTMVFVSHSKEAVEFLCDRAIWLNNGVIQKDGKTKSVLEEYIKVCG